MESIVGKTSRSYWMGIAMIWILVFHLINPICTNEAISSTLRQSLSRITGSGYLGVDIFLFLSSYGLCHSFVNNTYKNYLLRRLKRLFPVFILFIVAYIYFFVGVNDPIHMTKTTLMHITGLSTFSNISYAWYIPTTIFIYWSFPLWFYSVKWLEQKSMVLIWLLIIGMLFIKPLMIPYIFWLANGRFIMVVLGILTYLWLNDTTKKPNKNLLFLFLMPAILAAIFATSKVEIVGMSLPLLFFIIDRAGIYRYGEKFFNFIGKHTLEIYLAQCITIEWFTPQIVQLIEYQQITHGVKFAFAMVLEIVLTIALAFVLYHVQNIFSKAYAYKNRTATL